MLHLRHNLLFKNVTANWNFSWQQLHARIGRRSHPETIHPGVSKGHQKLIGCRYARFTYSRHSLQNLALAQLDPLQHELRSQSHASCLSPLHPLNCLQVTAILAHIQPVGIIHARVVCKRASIRAQSWSSTALHEPDTSEAIQAPSCPLHCSSTTYKQSLCILLVSSDCIRHFPFRAHHSLYSLPMNMFKPIVVSKLKSKFISVAASKLTTLRNIKFILFHKLCPL